MERSAAWEKPKGESRHFQARIWQISRNQVFCSRWHQWASCRTPGPVECRLLYEDRIEEVMFASLMVPLDRSPFSEQALPFAVKIAERAHASLEFVAIHRSYVFGDHHASNAWALKLDSGQEAEIVQQEEEYLAEQARRVMAESKVLATTAVLSGSVVDSQSIAERILEQAQLKNADLIVMTTHGRRQMSRLGLGSVADELVRRSHLPVLLVSPGDEDHPKVFEPKLDHFLIPLDGSKLSERILVPALELAQLTNARGTLLRVVSARCSDEERKGAEEYLEQVAASARQQGIDVQTKVISSSHPVDTILQEAESRECNLITVATHGYGGFKRMLLGSVADKIVRHAPMPVLVHCPNQ